MSLERLCQEANCPEIDQLAEAEQHSQTGTRLKKELSAVLDELMIATAGDDLGRLHDRSRTKPIPMRSKHRSRISRQGLLPSEKSNEAVQETIGAAREAVLRMNGGAAPRRRLRISRRSWPGFTAMSRGLPR